VEEERGPNPMESETGEEKNRRGRDRTLLERRRWSDREPEGLH